MKTYIILLLLFCSFCSIRAEDLQSFQGCQLVAADWNDGDSFQVRLPDGRIFGARLYYVDCCESRAPMESDARRVRKQQRYFGLPDAQDVFAFGNKAAEFTRQQLSKPFTMHTAFAGALGRGPSIRVYAFVTTADGRDLATLLVDAGLARAYGVGRSRPDGTSQAEAREELADREVSAMLNRAGIWAMSNPERLVELRAQQRREDRELASIQGRPELEGPINPNTATEDLLRSLPGIGPVMAQRIIQCRPYHNPEDLLNVPGIGSQTFEKLVEFIDLDGNGS